MTPKQKGMVAIARKDIREALSTTQVKLTLFLVPMVFVLMFPAMLLIMYLVDPNILAAELEELPMILDTGITGLFFNQLQPVFFLMIPVMVASISAANSFVGERERRTLETLLFSPLSVRDIFFAKALGCFVMSMVVTFASFIVFAIVATVTGYVIDGRSVLSVPLWLVTMLCLSPALTALGILFTVRISAKAQSFQEAQQKSGLLVLPIMLLFGSQFSGILMLTWWIGLILAVILIGIVWLLFRALSKGLTYDGFLQ